MKYSQTLLLVLGLAVISMTGCEKVINVVEQSQRTTMDDPESGNDEQKRTWAIRHEGFLFGTGYYEPIPEEAQ